MAVANRSRHREKAERLEARLSPEQKRVLAKAAAYAGQSLSQFVLTSAERAAAQVLGDHEVITLSARDSLVLLDALRNPGPPAPKLVEAAEQYKAFMGEA